MPSLMQPSQDRMNALHQTVRVVNLSDETFIDEFNRAEYEIPPKCELSVPAMVANHWFGDPVLKGDENPRIWETELRRVRNRCGNPNAIILGTNPPQPDLSQRHFERLLASGKVFCVEYATQSPSYYEKTKPKNIKRVKGTPISAARLQQMEENPLLPPMGPLRELSEEEVIAMTSSHMGAKHGFMPVGDTQGSDRGEHGEVSGSIDIASMAFNF
jgi:hypothetical protein